MTLGPRLLEWGVILGFALISGVASSVVIHRFCQSLPTWSRRVVQAMIYLLIILPVLFVLTQLPDGGMLPSGSNLLVVAVFALMLPLGALAMQSPWSPEAVPVAEPAAGAPPGSVGDESGLRAPPRLLDRLPPEMRGEVLHLSVRDHYVEVLTDRGRASILMRFSDAIAEANGVDGLQVHRSHWVARAAVAGGERERGGALLHLTDGSRVPVSRGCLPAVVAAGWLSA